MSDTSPMTFVDSIESLQRVMGVIAHAPWAAVDTEADSLHHYVEKLCLVQISIPEGDFIIDPLVPLDLRALADALSAKPLILHGADFDIRMLKKQGTFSPRQIFDTMIAAQLLGYERQGLADLAERHCGVILSKAAQKADWAKRPLDEKMLLYAANDTHYLKEIQLVLESELEAAGRLEWHRQCCEKLLRSLELVKISQTDPERDWQIKGSKKLKGVELTILKELWHWRDSQARRRDKPSFKILNSEYLIQISEWAGKNPGVDIAQWREAPRNVRGEYAETVNRLISNACRLPQAEINETIRGKSGKKWTMAQSKQFLDLKLEKEKIAMGFKINPSLLATNATLEVIVSGQPRNADAFQQIAHLMPWQAEILKESFLRILNS